MYVALVVAVFWKQMAVGDSAKTCIGTGYADTRDFCALYSDYTSLQQQTGSADNYESVLVKRDATAMVYLSSVIGASYQRLTNRTNEELFTTSATTGYIFDFSYTILGHTFSITDDESLTAAMLLARRQGTTLEIQAARISQQPTAGPSEPPTPVPTTPYGYSGSSMWFKLDNDVTDSGPNAIVATDEGDGVYSRGVHGQAYVFTGNDYINVADNGAHIADFDLLTYAAWVKSTAFGAHLITINKENTYESAIDNGMFKTAINADGPQGWYWFADSCSVNTLEEWYHTTVTFDGTYVRSYVDGFICDTHDLNDDGTVLRKGDEDLRFGARGGDGGASYQLTGLLDDIVFYDRVLSDSEVAQLITGNAMDGLVSWWKFDGDLTDSGPAALVLESTSSNPVYVAGVHGQAWQKNPSDMVLRSTDTSSTHAHDLGYLSILAWVYHDGSSGELMIVNKENTYEVRVSGSILGSALQPCWRWWSASSASVPANTWTHIAVTYDGRYTRQYVNGAFVGKDDCSGSADVEISPNDHDLMVGSRGGDSSVSSHFAGSLDDVLIFDRALARAEIKYFSG